MMHEASLHRSNCFWTVTYDDPNLPPGGSLRMSDVSAFLKRLRRRVEPVKFRFQAMSEYGPRTFRPHYHGLFFGFDFPDRKVFRRTDAGVLSYTSDLLTEAWGLGHCEVSDLTIKSVRYCAKHNVDKLDGALADEFYSRVDPVSGEVFELERESSRYSNRPGIGAGWLAKFESDCFPTGFVISNGKKVPVPPYYKKVLKDRFKLRGSDAGERLLVPVDDFMVMSRKAKARARSPEVVANSTPDRLAVREEVRVLALKRLKRDAI